VKQLERTDRIAQRYGQRPATLLGITDPYLAYCLDEAVSLVGLDAERRAYAAAQQEAEAQHQTAAPERPASPAPPHQEREPMIMPSEHGLVISGTVPFIGRKK
jgi:hypothetical protein